MYFKRKSTKGWKGPAKVLGKEGNFVLIRLGNSFYRCHPCHLMKVDCENSLNKRGGVDPLKETSSARDADKKTHVKVCAPLDDSDGSDDEVVEQRDHTAAPTEHTPASAPSNGQDSSINPIPEPDNDTQPSEDI